jgi:hypothetical protein
LRSKAHFRVDFAGKSYWLPLQGATLIVAQVPQASFPLAERTPPAIDKVSDLIHH